MTAAARAENAAQFVTMVAETPLSSEATAALFTSGQRLEMLDSLIVMARTIGTTPPGPAGGLAAAPERRFEGFVKYADGTVVCVQCTEGRHGECPAEDKPALDGYYCECSDPAHPQGAPA